jgi:AcrR family transcriptional regulator
MATAPKANVKKTPATLAKPRGKSGTAETNATIDRILDAAEEEFAEKGVSGARVERIAARADVAKALIYYYFKGKDELLKAVIARALRESVSYKLSALGNLKEGEDTFETLSRAGTAYIENKLNVLRIMMLELLRKEDTGEGILEIIDELFASARLLSRDTPMFEKLFNDEAKTELFFFGSIPVCLFLLLEDKWSGHYQMDRESMRKRFMTSAVKVIHMFLDEESGAEKS